MTAVAATVTTITDTGVTVIADAVDRHHELGPMESLISGITVGSKVWIEGRDDVPGTWIIIGEFANLPAPATAPRSSTMTARWKARKRVADTVHPEWRVAASATHAVADTADTRWKARRRTSDTADARWQVLGNATFLGWDIRPYMRQPGGQKILLAPGNYHAGKLPPLAGSAYEHPINPALPYAGRLRIGAQIPGTVKLYGDPTGGGRFSFTDPDLGGALGWGWDGYYDGAGYGTLGVEFEDIDFINGRTVFTAASDYDFINCTWVNPPAVWKQNYDQICQLMHVPVVDTIPNTPQYRAVFDSDYWKGGGTPSGLRLQGLASWNPFTNSPVPHGGVHPQRVRIISCDQHDIMDDAVFADGNHLMSRGMRTWNVGLINYGPGPAAWIHPDGWQTVGAEDDHDVEAWEAHCHLELFAENPGNLTRMRFVRIRQLMSYGNSIGAINQFRDVAGLIDYFVWGANNVNATNGDYEYSEGHPWYPMPDTSDYFPITLHYTWPPDGVHMKHLTKTDLANLGYTMGGYQNRALVDVTQAVNDPANFANTWRAQNPTNTEANRLATINSLGGFAWAPA